jgi:hypothetical protein
MDDNSEMIPDFLSGSSFFKWFSGGGHGARSGLDPFDLKKRLFEGIVTPEDRCKPCIAIAKRMIGRKLPIVKRLVREYQHLTGIVV